MIERSRSPKGNTASRVNAVIALCLALTAGFPGAPTQAGAGAGAPAAIPDKPGFHDYALPGGVGESSWDPFVPLAPEAGDGWSIVSSPNASAGENYLLGVTCVSASDCWAVGYSKVGTVAQTLIERWDGTSWAIVTSPNSLSAQYSFLYGVTCVSASECWAVGTYYSGSAWQTLIERWDGTSWAIVNSPNTSATRDAILYGVTCVSASECWAVGYSTNTSFYAQTLVERWDGTAWAIVSSPNASTAQANFLYGVTCVSASNCWAVGYIYTNSGITFQTLIERWDGTAWAIVSSPNTSTAQTNVLYGVTCVSASECWAVGSYINGTAEQTLIAHWDGTAWTVVTSPNTLPTQTNVLKTVTCVSASECWTVGYYINANGDYQTLIERWDGTSWAIVSSPNTSTMQSNILVGVTCVSASECWAVGYYFGSSGFPETLTMRYTASPDPDPFTSVDGLQAEPTGATLGVSGRASFGGEVPRVLATDPAGDAPIAAPASSAAGLDLLEGRIHRPDPSNQEIIFEWRVAALPASGSLPEVVRYVWAVQVGTARYWIQAKLSNVVATTTQSDAAGHVSHAGGAFQLLINCPNPSTVFGCSHVAWLEGAFDPAGSTVRVRVPLSTAAAPALKPGAVLAPQPPATGNPAIFAGYQATISTPEMRDDAAWPAAATYRIPAPEVLLGIATVGTDPSLVAFDTPATLAPDGAFSGSLDLTGLTAGTYEVWARACFGDNCGLRAVTIERS